MGNITKFTIDSPISTDGYELNRLIEKSPPLDTNSVYCNLLQCSHFHGTSVCARADGKIAGFVSGYLLPDRPETLFVWQVVVAASARGQGLALRMLQTLAARPACGKIDQIETTITADNAASQALFRKLAAALGTEACITSGFDRETHFHGKHATEELWRIGPITSQKRGSQDEDI